MKLSKFLSIVITNFIIITTYTKAQITIDCKENGQFCVNCDGRSHSFNNIIDLSNGINNVTRDYFTFDSVKYNTLRYNTIVFRGVCNSSNNECNLMLKGSENYKPTIDLVCYDTRKVVFGKVTAENTEIRIFVALGCKVESILDSSSGIVTFHTYSKNMNNQNRQNGFYNTLLRLLHAFYNIIG